MNLHKICITPQMQYQLQRYGHANLLESNRHEPHGRAARPAPTLFSVSKTMPILLSGILLSITTVTSAQAALTSITANTIEGTAPYIKVNNVEARDLSSLLSIKIGGVAYKSDKNGDMQKDNGSGTWVSAGSLSSPITFNAVGDDFDSVVTVLPADTVSYSLNSTTVKSQLTLQDNDGDSGFVLSGDFKGEWTDKNNNSVGSNLTGIPSGCLGPYTLTLETQNNPTITTQYGIPNTTTYGNNKAVFKINPVSGPRVCYAKPNMSYATVQYAGPSTMWDTSKGFLLQSDSDYTKNFPTTGANNLFFDLEIAGVPSALTWDSVTVNGITATMSAISNTRVRVTLSAASTAPVFTSPTEIVLIGKDSSNMPVVKYGFKLQKWFFSNTSYAQPSVHMNQCNQLNSSFYRLTKKTDLTNAYTSGASPSSTGNYYMRYIGAGLFSEWGNMTGYIGSGFNNSYFYYATITNNSYVRATDGFIYVGSGMSFAVCVTP